MNKLRYNKKNLLFLLVDCLRVDKSWGPKRTDKTPTIDSLYSKGTAFLNTISTTSTTTQCVASIFTGVYPRSHGIRSLRWHKLNPDRVTLAEIFSENGYNTYAEVAGILIPETGLDKGFDYYHCRERGQNFYSRWGKSLIKRFKDREFKEPWFTFIHFLVIHHPRKILKEFDVNEFGINRYARAVSSFDAHLGKLLKYVNDDTIIVLHGDHGERIAKTIIERGYNKLRRKLFKFKKKLGLTPKWKKGLWITGHGWHVYDDMIKVPLVFVGKGIFPENKLILQQVRQIDVFPTIIDALGLDVDKDTKIRGRSLVPLIKGEKMEEAPAYCEAADPKLGDEKNWRVGIRTSKFKFVYAPHNQNIPDELYDLENDPLEKKNIVKKMPKTAQELKRKIEEEYLKKGMAKREPMAPEEIEKMEKRLKELGYL